MSKYKKMNKYVIRYIKDNNILDKLHDAGFSAEAAELIRNKYIVHDKYISVEFSEDKTGYIETRVVPVCEWT